MQAKPVMMGTKAHQKLREQLQQDVENFLNNGGVITIVEPGVQTLLPVVEVITDALGNVSKKVSNPIRSRIYAVYDHALLQEKGYD